MYSSISEMDILVYLTYVSLILKSKNISKSTPNYNSYSIYQRRVQTYVI